MIKHFIVYAVFLNSLFGANISDNALEIYYDTPNLFLYKNKITLKYQAKGYVSKNKKIKYHENIIYKLKDKDEVSFKVKHYNKVKSIEDKHPLLSLIKRKDRQTFINLLKVDGIKYPLKLKYLYDSSKSHTKPDLNDTWFQLKFHYPYLFNLFYSLAWAFFGLLFIVIIFRKKLIQ